MSTIDQAFISAFRARIAASKPAPGPASVEPLTGASTATAAPSYVTPGAGTTTVTTTLHEASRTAVAPPKAKFRPETTTRARGPLSEFTLGHRPAKPLWRPAVTLARFEWPAMVGELTAAASDLLENTLAATRIRSELPATIAIAGAEPECGATTTLLGLAKVARAAQLRTLVIDAAQGRPRLAEALGVLSGPTLSDALRRNLDLGAAAIFSQADNLSLCVLGTNDESPALIQAAIRDIAQHHDLTLIDLGRSGGAELALASRALLVHRRTGRRATLADRSQQLAAAGYAIAGIVEIDG